MGNEKRVLGLLSNDGKAEYVTYDAKLVKDNPEKFLDANKCSKGLFPLPDGWFSAVDKASKETYYWRKDDQGNQVDVTWVRPTKTPRRRLTSLERAVRLLKRSQSAI